MKALYTLWLMLLFTQAFAQPFERYKPLLDTLFPSTELGYSRALSITVPLEYQQNVNASFPLILVFDKQNTRSHTHILRTIDYLTANEQIPSALILSIGSEVENRYGETQLSVSDPSAFGEKNERFIFNELMPFARKNYKASNFSLFIGHSRYGFFTTHLFARNPQQCNAVIALSPFFQQEKVNLVDSLHKTTQQTDFSEPRFYRFAVGNDYPDQFQLFEQKLGKKSGNKSTSFNLKGQIFPEADHNAVPGIAIAPALYEIFEAWSFAQRKFMLSKAPTALSLDTLQREISKAYGSSIPPALGILNGKGWEAYNKQQYQQAIEAWQALLRYYPTMSEAWLYIADAQKNLNVPFKSAVERFYAEIQQSSFYTTSEKEELIEEAREWERSLEKKE